MINLYHFLPFPQAVIYRWQQAVPPTMDVVKKILMFINFAYTVLVLNYSCVGFIVSALSRSLAHADMPFLDTYMNMNTCDSATH